MQDVPFHWNINIVARALRALTPCYPSSIMDPSELREIFEHFRILIIGRANAGKTTILQRVCKTRENPEIYNSAGEKVQFMIPVVTRMMMVNRCTLHWKSDRSRCVDDIQRGKACSWWLVTSLKESSARSARYREWDGVSKQPRIRLSRFTRVWGRRRIWIWQGEGFYCKPF